jgi:zinc transport system ATP-binding protein
MLVDASGLVKAYDGRRVLSDVGIAVAQGEIVTLIGPNGAGKTVLLRILLGLETADAGRVVRASDLTVGYMPQKIAIDASLPLSVARFVGLAGRFSRDRIAAALGETGIAARMEAPIQGLSGGEFQRALLARALLRQPQLLVLDEPAQGVDVTGQEELYDLLARVVAKQGCGVLLVSHDLHLVMARADRVVCLNGHVCCTGKPAALGNDPAFAALFGARGAASVAVYRHSHDHVHAVCADPAHDHSSSGPSPAHHRHG